MSPHGRSGGILLALVPLLLPAAAAPAAPPSMGEDSEPPGSPGRSAAPDPSEVGPSEVGSSEVDPAEVDAPDGSAGPSVLRIEKGEYEIAIPREEELVYRAHVGLVLLATPVGTVTISSRVEPYREPVLLAPSRPNDEPREVAHLRIHAKGDYAFYKMDATVEARLLPTDWPWIVYRTDQRGSEHRRRELLVGWRDGEPYGRFRKDTNRGAPRGTRLWRDPEDRVLPKVPLDLLTATYHARKMIRERLDEMTFPVADKLVLWDVHLRRGARSVQRTGAGEFETVEIVLTPEPHEGEEASESKEERFEGLFGIHGSMHLFVCEKTGVPVRIQGDVPLGPFTAAVDIGLADYEGTPPAFRPIRR